MSMGANAAVQMRAVINNVERILAIELLNASQALYFRSPRTSSPFLETFLQAFRNEVPFVEKDKFLHEDINKAIKFLQGLNVDNELLFD